MTPAELVNETWAELSRERAAVAASLSRYPVMMTAGQVAEALCCGKDSVLRSVRTGAIPAYKPPSYTAEGDGANRVIRIPRYQVLSILLTGKPSVIPSEQLPAIPPAAAGERGAPALQIVPGGR